LVTKFKDGSDPVVPVVCMSRIVLVLILDAEDATFIFLDLKRIELDPEFAVILRFPLEELEEYNPFINLFIR
jgi:hypothetical protein